MGDLIFVAVVVAFFALTVAYVKACERIVGRDTGADATADGEVVAGDDAEVVELERTGAAR
jgi:hypothetical protein